jgi:hypothetical protein
MPEQTYEVQLKKTLVETYRIKAWSAKQAREEYEELLEPGQKPEKTGVIKVKRICVRLFQDHSDSPQAKPEGNSGK